jgi:hypothetical protein
MLQQTNSLFVAGPDWEIENELFSSLSPVNPDPVFVTRLEERLKTQPLIVLERNSVMGAYLVVAFGLFGGVLLIWLLNIIFTNIRKTSG